MESCGAIKISATKYQRYNYGGCNKKVNIMIAPGKPVSQKQCKDAQNICCVQGASTIVTVASKSYAARSASFVGESITIKATAIRAFSGATALY